MSKKTRVLYIVGACLFNNTSANMSHNAFIKGFIENGCQVDVIMANDSWGKKDSSLKLFEEAEYYEFNSISFSDNIRKKFSNADAATATASRESDCSSSAAVRHKASLRQSLRQIAKKIFYFVFKPDKIYPLDKTWIKNACLFSAKKQYDLVVSNSSPSASHKLADLLIKKGNIYTSRWIQIWEDPWFSDIYGGNTEAVKEEEHYLLRQAQEIIYVSPLTLMYQKNFFPDCADKMKCVPLPFLDFSNNETQNDIESNSFGYFGDYYSVTRNLKPFYEALAKSGYTGYIYGDNDLSLQATDKIQVSGRVTLDVLSKVQEKTEALVHLSNLQGGQIPGKIYHYSATAKPILFILDGTEEEKKALQDFFGKFNRYYFCENNTDDILAAMRIIATERKAFSPVAMFEPKNVVSKLL